MERRSEPQAQIKKPGVPAPGRKEVPMKGYYTNCGYMGLVGNEWILFAAEEEYHEYLQA